MKQNCSLILAVVFAATAGVITVKSQQPVSRPAAAAPAATTTTTAPTTQGAAAGAAATPRAVVGDAKIAIIYSEFFQDPKNGIARLSGAAGTVDKEFQPRKAELQTMQTRLTTMAQDIEKQKGLAQPEALQKKVDEAETLKREFERKQQDAQLAFEKRVREVMTPLSDDIGKALDVYARQRGISIMIDASKLQGAVYTFSDSIDVTRDFITEYNRQKPATASAATPASR